MLIPRYFLFVLLTGTAGFVGGKWAREGLRPQQMPPARHRLPAVGILEMAARTGSPEAAWMGRARQAAGTDFAGLLAEVDQLFHKGTNFEAREAARRWLLGLWVVQDAEAAASHVAELKDERLGCSFGLVLGSVAPQKVAAIVEGPFGKSLGHYFNSAVMHSLSAADPREYLRIADKPDAKSTPRYWARALAAIAAHDPAAAADLWGHRTGKRGGAALRDVMNLWVERDSQAALAWLEGLPDEASRHSARHSWLGALARTDIAAARKALGEMDAGEWVQGTSNLERYANDARTVTLGALARVDLPAALKDWMALEARGLPRVSGPAQEDDIGRAIQGPSEALPLAIVNASAASLPSEPAALLAALQGLKTGAGMTDEQFENFETAFLGAKLLRQSASVSLEAVQLLSGQPLTDARANLLTSLIESAARSDPARTIGYLASLPPEQRGSLPAAVLNAVPYDNGELLAQVAGILPANEWSRDKGRQLAQSPEKTAAAMAALPVSEETGLAREGFGQGWARNDPEAAARWAATLPQNPGSTHAARGITEAWAGYDDAAASAWAASLPPGRARDGAALGLAATVAFSEPDAAWVWAKSISDPQLAMRAYEQVAKRWGIEAPEGFRSAFTAALETAAVPAADRETMLRALTQPRDTTPASEK